MSNLLIVEHQVLRYWIGVVLSGKAAINGRYLEAIESDDSSGSTVTAAR
jgi:hypothetical protein